MRTLTSNRLTLRPIRDSDMPFLTSLLGSGERTKHLFGGMMMTSGQVLEFARQHFTPGDAPAGLGILVENHPENVVGFAGIIPTDCLGGQDFEFGFALSREAEGKGLATEIGYMQMRYALETLRLERILALAHPDNGASVHVLRDKLKMAVIAHIEATAHRGPRIVFCRNSSDGLPVISGKGWNPADFVLPVFHKTNSAS